MKFTSCLAAALLATAASAAMADDTPATVIPLTHIAPDLYAATFTRNVNGLFIDSFGFTPQSFTGDVSVSLVPLTPAVSFFVASINDNSFSYLPEDGSTTFSFKAHVDAGTPLTLTVFGATLDSDGSPNAQNGSYRATVLAAVPEPATYALMLVGLAGIGVAARRRRV